MADSSASAIIQQNKLAANPTSVSFPADIGAYFFALQFYDYRTNNSPGSSSTPVSSSSNSTAIQNFFSADASSVNAAVTKNSFAQVKLPIPSNLVDSFRVNYENTELGGLLGALSDTGLGSVMGGARNAAGSTGLGPAINAIKSGALGGLSQAGSAGAEGALAIGKLAAKYVTDNGLTFGSNISGLYDLATGSTVNPNLAVLFRGPSLKTHQFSWLLAARNATESANIKQIIAIIKRAMHPTRISGATSAILTYPSECLAEFVGVQSSFPPTQPSQVFLYPLRPCIVEDFNINYAPQNLPSFFQGTNESTAIEFSLTLQETSYYTRDSFDNTSSYGSDGYQTSALGTGETGFTST